MNNKNIHEDHKIKSDIIQSILSSDFSDVQSALEDNPNCVNAIHDDSGMNAAMLCAAGELPTYLKSLIEKSGGLLNYGHKDANGNDLMDIALSTVNKSVIDMTAEAYRQHAIHTLHNWPEP